MIDKNEIKKMWVWDNGRTRKKRYVLYSVDDGYNGCIAVQGQDEEIFERGSGNFEPLGWEHYEEIKEPESRAFKQVKCRKNILIIRIAGKARNYIVDRYVTVAILSQNCNCNLTMPASGDGLQTASFMQTGKF